MSGDPTPQRRDVRMSAADRERVMAYLQGAGVEMMAGAMKIRRLATEPYPGSGLHFVVTGTQMAGGLAIRPRRHFWRWHW